MSEKLLGVKRREQNSLGNISAFSGQMHTATARLYSANAHSKQCGRRPLSPGMTAGMSSSQTFQPKRAMEDIREAAQITLSSGT